VIVAEMKVVSGNVARIAALRAPQKGSADGGDPGALRQQAYTCERKALKQGSPHSACLHPPSIVRANSGEPQPLDRTLGGGNLTPAALHPRETRREPLTSHQPWRRGRQAAAKASPARPSVIKWPEERRSATARDKLRHDI
jgi:hypothetical protein